MQGRNWVHLAGGERHNILRVCETGCGRDSYHQVVSQGQWNQASRGSNRLAEGARGAHALFCPRKQRLCAFKSAFHTFHARLPQPANTMAINAIDRTAKEIVLTVQDYALFAWRAVINLFRPPIYWEIF